MAERSAEGCDPPHKFALDHAICGMYHFALDSPAFAATESLGRCRA